MKVIAASMIALALLPAALHAQGSRTGAGAFLVEAAGGTAGSLAGFGVGYALADRCDSEDLVCNLENAGTALLAGTVLAAVGTYIAGRLGDTEPSALGAGLRAVAGAAAGIGAWHLLTEELDVVTSDAGAVAS